MQGQALIILMGGLALALPFVWMSARASRIRRYLDDTPTSEEQGAFIGELGRIQSHLGGWGSA